VRKVIENVDINVVWPTWTVPELPTWERDGLVLVGDAAHALQVSLIGRELEHKKLSQFGIIYSSLTLPSNAAD
jgi:hypothetical protein